MSTVFFTADQHFNHSNIIPIMGRPFIGLEEMHEALISNHNKIVKPGDRVYHLGDFAWHDHNKFLPRLNGQHYLVKGNHDHISRLKDPLKFIWVKDTEFLKVGEHKFFLSHYAHRVWPESHYGSYHLYGHSHGMLDKFHGRWGRSMDVGVDLWDFRPVSIDDVLFQLTEEPYKNHHPEA